MGRGPGSSSHATAIRSNFRITVKEQSYRPRRGLICIHARDFCIIVAEDDDLLRYCTVHLLEKHVYRIIEARDGQEALDLVEKCNDEVHLLITNFEMPRLNGSELARRLREKHEKLVVLLISGADHGLAPSADFEVLPKPYNDAALTHKVRELLRRGAGERPME